MCPCQQSTRSNGPLNLEDPAGNEVGGWTRPELHHGSILQFASLYAISHAVRTSTVAVHATFYFIA